MPPFAAADAGELLRMHVASGAPDARRQRPDLSPVLAAIIGKLLAKDPDDRYQTARSDELVPAGRCASFEAYGLRPTATRMERLASSLMDWSLGSGRHCPLEVRPGSTRSHPCRRWANSARLRSTSGEVVLL